MEELHRRAWPLVEPVLRSNEAVAASAHRALQDTGRTRSEPAEVLTVAQQGQVETPVPVDPKHPNGSPASMLGR
jgi:hypothetical protein